MFNNGGEVCVLKIEIINLSIMKKRIEMMLQVIK
jgi:hypothetical protein